MALLVAVVAILGYSNKGESLLNIARSLIVDTSGRAATGSSSTMRLSQFENMMNILKGKDFLFGYGSGFLASESNLRESLTLEMRGFESVIFQKVFDSGIFGCIAFFVFFKRLFDTLKIQCTSQGFSLAMFFLSYLIAVLLTGVQGGSFSFFLVFSFACVFFLQKKEEKNTERKNAKIG